MYSVQKEIIMKKLLLVVFVIVAITFIRQQGEINDYNNKIEDINSQIAYEEKHSKELEEKSDLYSSDDYIEKVARDELGLVKADEKVFVDANSK
ncbi:MAG: septum formation initiator family protein [Ruminococcaceae bacterium]|nr:septum formation initiator family protein [Oscillospiraceae bacterium]